METRALLAFVISVAILIGYQVLFAPPPPPVTVPSVVEGAVQPAAGGTGPAGPLAILDEPDRTLSLEPERLLEIDTDLYHAVFTSRGGRLKHFQLKRHRVSAAEDSPPLDMVVSGSSLPLGLYWSDSNGATAVDSRVDYQISGEGGPVAAGRTRTIVLSGIASDGARVTKTIDLTNDSYVLDVRARVDAATRRSIGLAWARGTPEVAGGSFAGVEGPVAYVENKLQSHSVTDLEEPVTYQGATDWAGYADHYFLAAYYPEQPRALRFVGAAAGELGEVILWDDQADGEVAYKLFVGPKKIKLLNSLGHNLPEAVDLGYFAFVARPLLELMIFLHRFTGNYGWTIVLLTVGIRAAFYPINKRQIEAMKAMQRIQPELKRIQEKYKDDREKLNKEMIEVYRRHKVNPLSGCLPMVVQLPVFLGLYNALMQSIELRHAPFVGWIYDLSLPDRLGTLHIPFVDPPGVPVLTLLMGASMFVQQKMTPSTADPVQQRMMMFLPAVFTLMFINFPSGLVLYWLANNVLSVAQQQFMTRGTAA